MRQKRTMKNNLFQNTKSFIEQNSSIEEAVEKFKKEAEDTLVVLDNNFSIKGSVYKEDVMNYYEQNKNSRLLKKEKISKLISIKKSTIIMYPQNNIREVLALMNNMKPKAIAIANNPWEKKFLGIIMPKGLKNLKTYQSL